MVCITPRLLNSCESSYGKITTPISHFSGKFSRHSNKIGPNCE